MITDDSAEVAALERWADQVAPAALHSPGPLALRLLAAGVDQRDAADDVITEAIRRARAAGQSWSQIAAVLGVSKQAAQRKYSAKLTA